MGNSKSHTIHDAIIDLKLKSKELHRLSLKSEKEIKISESKVKRAIEKGNIDGARVYATDAIRKKHEAIHYLKLSSKLDAAASRLEAAYNSEAMTADLCKAIPRLNKALNTLDSEHISLSMHKFEKIFENLDVRSEFVTAAIDTATVSVTPEDEINNLINRIADEHALDVEGIIINPSTVELRNSDARSSDQLVNTRQVRAQPASIAHGDSAQELEKLEERMNELFNR